MNSMLKLWKNPKPIETIDQLNQIPDKSIVWYPCHAENWGAWLSGRALKQFIKDNRFLREADGSLVNDVLTPEFCEIVKQDIEELKSDKYDLGFYGEIPIVETCSDENMSEYDDETGEDVLDENSTFAKEITTFIQTAYDKGWTEHYAVSYIGPKWTKEDDSAWKNGIRTYWSFD